jgi:hypothetical protein
MRHPLEPVRDYYLDCFRHSIESARTQFDQFTNELLLELPSLKYSAYCHRLYRADIIGKRADENRVVEVNVAPKTAPLSRHILPSIVKVEGALVWNGIEFRVTDAEAAEDDLVTRASKWLDLSDSRYEVGAQLQHVVHSVTPPQTTDRGYQLSVDFGSAPTVAFDELLAVVARDARGVAVGSFIHLL